MRPRKRWKTTHPKIRLPFNLLQNKCVQSSFCKHTRHTQETKKFCHFLSRLKRSRLIRYLQSDSRAANSFSFSIRCSRPFSPRFLLVQLVPVMMIWTLIRLFHCDIECRLSLLILSIKTCKRTINYKCVSLSDI